MSNGALWSILLIVVGCAIIVLEFFVPSGGLLTVAAVAALVAALVIGFSEGLAWGTGVTVGMLLGVPATLLLMIRVWPYTPIGRRILTRVPGEESDVLPDDEPHRQRRQLVGKIGVASSDLLPSGAIRIENVRYDALSISGGIDAGEPVRVTGVQGRTIYVVKSEKPAPPARPADPEHASLRELGLEELEDPLS